jgi:hypothetical protein
MKHQIAMAIEPPERIAGEGTNVLNGILRRRKNLGHSDFRCFVAGFAERQTRACPKHFRDIGCTLSVVRQTGDFLRHTIIATLCATPGERRKLSPRKRTGNK